MGRGGHDQIGLISGAGGRFGADDQDRQFARRDSRPQVFQSGLIGDDAGVQDRRLQRHVFQNTQTSRQRARRDSAPAQGVEPVTQVADHLVITGDDQNAGVRSHERLLQVRSSGRGFDLPTIAMQTRARQRPEPVFIQGFIRGSMSGFIQAVVRGIIQTSPRVSPWSKCAIQGR